VRTALERGRATARGVGDDRFVAVAWHAGASPSRIEETTRSADAVFAWDARVDGRGDGALFVCLGEAERIEGRGRERWGAARAGAEALFSRIVSVGDASPRLVGGGAFEPGGSEQFKAFGDVSFVLPRLSLEQEGTDVVATLVARPRELEHIDALEDEIARLTTPAPAIGREPSGLELVDESPERFMEMVDHAVRAIEAGAVDKVVLARAAQVRGASLSWPEVFAAVADQQATTRFAVVRGDQAFVGATPERLVALDGLVVSTEALAGSRARSSRDDDDRRALLESDKDRREHALVVDAIVRALGPRSSRVDAPAAPTVRTLRHLHHLATPIRAILRRPLHVLSLVEALHPTPAVSGYPVAGASGLLAALEGRPRGWYAAPVGYFDRRGCGVFAVGLRSALVEAGGATVFAGAGIVRGSQARAEWEETRTKATAMLRALGVA
jgi:isochorismate synthase